MAGTKISALTAVTPLSGSESVPVVQSGTTKKATASLIAAAPRELWETGIIAAMGAVQCDPGAAMLQMQRAGNIAPTPTNITTSIARCELFRPPQTLTINTIRFYGVGNTTDIYHCAIYRYSDLARLTADLNFSTAADTWGTAGTSLALALTGGTLYFIACSVDTTGATAGIGSVGGTIAATTGRVVTVPESLPGKLQPSLGYLNDYRFEFAVTTGALPDPAATLAAPSVWTGGMPLFFLET